MEIRPNGGQPPKAVAEPAKRRELRDHATVVLDQGAREGRFVPTGWLKSAARHIVLAAEGAKDPLVKAVGADARRALAEAEARTGEGEAAQVLTAFLKDAEARLR